MAAGLERNNTLLEIKAVSFLRQQVLAGGIGLCTAGPLGAAAAVVAFRQLAGFWLPWALVGVLAAPPLAYGQWWLYKRVEAMASGGNLDTANPEALQEISEADRIARTCAEAVRNNQPPDSIRNPVDGTPLYCDRSYPSFVFVTSKRFNPLQQPMPCGSSELKPGTTGVQYEISPLGKISCAAIQTTTGLFGWLSGNNDGSRQALYRRCTSNLRLEARHRFEKTAVQLGRPDYCAQERALLARDLVQGQP
jgi:hypothetical protein